MPYRLDDERISLDDLLDRINETDLVPSREALLENIDSKFNTLKTHGYSTLADLRTELKTAQSLASLSRRTGIDTGYLALLRREVEGYFPSAVPLRSFDWLPKEAIEKLAGRGITDSALAFEALDGEGKRAELSAALGVDLPLLESLYALADLVRIQWVSPTAARMLAAAGYAGARQVAEANADALCEALEKANQGSKYFKGRIGLQDIRRLVKAASYVP